MLQKVYVQEYRSEMHSTASGQGNISDANKCNMLSLTDIN